MMASLNHVYRIIWSEARNAWVAVSELACAKVKRAGSGDAQGAGKSTAISGKPWLRRIALALACSFAFNAQANPVGAQVVNGAANISQIGNTLTVTNSPNAIINWQAFSIGSGETTRFVQQSASSAVLNRVVGADPSQLLGTLASNGKVFLINPNGILVGQGARIDVAGLVASTLNLSNENFLAGRLNFGATPNAGSVRNAGSISTPEGGTVYLVAPQVENAGIINTPGGETLLAAGNTVQLMDTATPGVSVQVTGADNNATNVGRILADSGRVGVVGAVVRNSGTLSASSLVSRGGRVFLKAGKDAYVEKNARIEASGTQGGSIEVLGNRVAVTDNSSLDASGQNGGGTILVGGDYQGRNPEVQNAAITYFGADASIKADALSNGNGGKVIVWADDTTRAYGSISAKGGQNGGNGGFVETSGHRTLDVTRAPDLAAPRGKAGAWLLDPENITISSSASSNNTNVNPFTPAAAGNSILSDAVLRAALVAGGTVTVDTTGGSAGTGNILVDATANLAGISAGTAAILNLKAHNDITVNSPITATGLPLSMSLIADQDSNGSGAIFVNAALNSNGGDLGLSSGVGGISGPGSLAGNNLAVRSIGSVDLSVGSSAVNNLAAQAGDGTHQNNNFRFRNSGSLNVGSNINGISGIHIDIDGANFNSASPGGVIALISGFGLTQSAGALLGGKAVYAEGGNVNLTLANPTGVIAGKLTGTSASDNFNYTSSNGINVTTVNGFSGIAVVDATNPHQISLAAGGAGISQDSTAPITGITAGLMLNTAGAVNLGAAGNNVGALGTAANSSQFSFHNNSGLILGVSGNGVATSNQLVSISAGGLLTVKDGVSAGTGDVTLEAPDIQIGTTGFAGTAISGGGFIKLRTGAAGTISTAGTSASTLTSSSGIALEADNINFAIAPTLNATNEISFKTSADNRSITIGSACNGADPSCLKLDGAFLSSASVNAPDLVIGNEVVADTNTAGNIHVDAAISHTGRVALVTAGSIDQSAAITATGLGIIAGGNATLNASNAITNLAGKSTGGAFSFINGQTLDVVTITGGLGPNTVTLSGVMAPGGVTLQTTGATSDIVLDNVVTSSAGGNAVVLAAGRNFVNHVGAAALSAPNGRWLIYSANPANNTFGSLVSANLPVWNKTYTAYAPASVTEAGNRYLFSFQPNLVASVNGGNITKTYGVDLTSTPPATTIAGLVDAASFGNVFTQEAYTGSGATSSAGFAANAHVQGGTPYAVTVAGNLIAPAGYGTTIYNDVALTVDPAVLSASLTNSGVTKTYDGTLSAPTGFTPAYGITGLIAGDTAATLTSSTAVYDNAHVAGATQLIVSGLGIGGIAGSNGSVAGDYTLNGVSSLAVAADITPRLLTASLTNSGVTKTYDGTASAPTGFTPAYSITGLIAGDTAASLSNTGATYNDAHVTNANTLTVFGLGINSIAGSNASVASDYTLNGVSSLDVAASITPRALTATASIGGTLTKTYDGTTAAPNASVSGNVTGGIAGDSFALDASSVSLAYNNAHVASATSIGATGTAGYVIASSSAGSLTSDYTFTPPVIPNVAASITRALLSVTANDDAKENDGTAYSGGNGVAYAGFVNGENEAVLGGALIYGGSSQGAISEGSYSIVPGGLNSGDYTLNFINGTLTVTAPVPSAVIDSVTSTTTAAITDLAEPAPVNEPTNAGVIATDSGSALTGASSAGNTSTTLGGLDSGVGGIGGSAGAFGGEATSPDASAKGGDTGSGTGKSNGDSAKQNDKGKKEEEEKKKDTARKDEGNGKDEKGGKDKQNAKPEKC